MTRICKPRSKYPTSRPTLLHNMQWIIIVNGFWCTVQVNFNGSIMMENHQIILLLLLSSQFNHCVDHRVNSKYPCNLFWFFASNLETQSNCFVVLSLRWNYSIAHHCSHLPRRELPREPLPTNRAKAPVQTSARQQSTPAAHPLQRMRAATVQWTCSDGTARA